MKNKTTSQTLTKPISGCARLYQLLSAPPKQNIQQNRGSFFPQVILGSAGVQVSSTPDMETKTFDENSNQIIRALAACQMGLFVHPSDENTYIAASKDLEENMNLSKAASGK